MKAIQCKAFGPPSSLVLEEVANLKPKAKEVLVEVKACGLNFPDTLIIQGLYQFKPELPFTPGSDVAGIVKEVSKSRFFCFIHLAKSLNSTIMMGFYHH